MSRLLDDQLFIYIDEHGRQHTVRVTTLRMETQAADVEDVNTGQQFEAIPLGRLRALPSAMRK